MVAATKVRARVGRWIWERRWLRLRMAAGVRPDRGLSSPISRDLRLGCRTRQAARLPCLRQERPKLGSAAQAAALGLAKASAQEADCREKARAREKKARRMARTPTRARAFRLTRGRGAPGAAPVARPPCREFLCKAAIRSRCRALERRAAETRLRAPVIPQPMRTKDRASPSSPRLARAACSTIMAR